MPTSLIPAGLVTIVAESSGAPTDAPPIESCTGPKPIMRMPLVAAAGAADSSAAAASTPRYETIFMWVRSSVDAVRPTVVPVWPSPRIHVAFGRGSGPIGTGFAPASINRGAGEVGVPGAAEGRA